LRDRKRQLGNLANNNLASRKILSFQAPSHPEPDSSPSCKQHPSSTAALAGL
jgi:hypothetical protein